ncbi:MAG TPA: GxxExxY protein, partial [Leptospiraceae bacterium]|nr:GxxExxY protein [Leptospiraceae bacterium]
DKRYDRVLEKDLTDRIIGACMEVSNTLGVGFLESVYDRALLIELDRMNINYKSQAKLSVVYKGINVGDFIADVFVEEKVILELKVTNSIVKEMQAQLMNYLKASGIKIGYLINFGNPKLEWKRIVL